MTDEGGDPACWSHLFDHDDVQRMTDEQLARFARSAADAIVICDREGVITFWNASAEAMFGWPAPAAIGSSLDLIIPERFRGRHWAGWHAAIAAGTTRYADQLLQVPAIRNDASTISIASSMTLLFDGEAKVEAVVAVIRDETAARSHRLELEAKLREGSG